MWTEHVCSKKGRAKRDIIAANCCRLPVSVSASPEVSFLMKSSESIALETSEDERKMTSWNC